MSYKATFDIAVNFSYITIQDFHKAGSLYYKACLYYINRKDSQKNRKYAFPFSFAQYQNQQNQQNARKHQVFTIKTISQPFIDEDQIHFVSRSFPVNYTNRNFVENTVCYFKAHIDIQMIDEVDFYIEVQLIFKSICKQNLSSFFGLLPNQHTSINTFVGKINKPYGIFSYLPICFDQFEFIMLNGTYHAIISQFKFSNQEDEQLEKISNQNSFFNFSGKSQKIFFNSFTQYLNNITETFCSKKIRTFFNFYRQFLINTFSNLQQNIEHYTNVVIGKQYKKSASTKKKQYEEFFKVSQSVSTCFTKMFRNNLDIKSFQNAKQQLSEYILEDFSHISQEIYKKWIKFNQIIQKNSVKIIKFQLPSYNQLIEQRYKNNIFSHKIKQEKQKDLTFSRYDDGGKSHHYITKQVNSKKTIEQDNVWKDTFLIQEISFIQKQQKNIKMFQQIYEVSNIYIDISKAIHQKDHQIYKQKNEHIIFLVHGFGASRSDLLLLKRFIQIKYEVKALISIENIGKTEDSLEKSGQRLANQVKKYCDCLKQKFKLSFIGHSMGGLIIRSALTKLQKYKQYFHTYISICSPHLGYLYEPTSLTRFGLWMLNQMQKCDSINQLEMKDDINLRKCYLYNLARHDKLQYFKNIAFIASSQDQYVPYESARVQKSERILSSLNENQKSSVIEQMVDGILKNFKKAKQISRIDVIFNIQQKVSLQSLIGRIGHVKFLSDQQFIKQFVICFKRFFQ